MQKPSKPRSLLLLVVLAMVATVLSGGFAAGAGAVDGGLPGSDPAVVTGAEVGALVVPLTFDGDLRDLPRARQPRAGDPILDVRQDHGPNPLATTAAAGPDPLLSQQRSSQTRTFDPPDLNFAGIPGTGRVPPDTVGEVGRNHYIQMVNSTVFRIWGKNGFQLVGDTTLDTLWTASGGLPADPCATGSGDPIPLYDNLVDRWVLSEFASTGNHLCIYVSQTPDPVSGGWFIYDFTTPGFPDYPKYGVWPDAYYVGTNEPNPTLGLYALDRVRMLAGQPATFQRFTLTNLAGFNFQMLLPADLDGPAPPAGTPGIFMRANDDELHNPGGPPDPTQDVLELYEFSVDWVTPGNSTLTGPTNIGVAEFDSDLCGGSRNCVPQPGTAIGLDAISQVMMWRLQYRNFGTHQTLVGNFTVDVDGADQAGIRWFELRKPGPAWNLFQEGTYAPDTDGRWMGSAAMDAAGNIALGYSVSSGTTFPSIRYTGRDAGDAAGTMPLAEVNVVAGAESQTFFCGGNPCNRWGDYSSMNVDPIDGCTFWYTTEFMNAGNWATQIARFRFPSCSVATCEGEDATVLGSGISDTLIGTDGDDVIVGLGGSDVMRGNGGSDLMCGGGGSDLLYGGDGIDVLVGGGGTDELRGNDGADELRGGASADLLLGGNGNDVLSGADGPDQLRGGADDDSILGGNGNDVLQGDRGTDSLKGGRGTDTCRSGETYGGCESF